MHKTFLVLPDGALGTGFRYGRSTLINSAIKQPEFPYGTFIINVTGSFVTGILASLFAARPSTSGVLRAVLMWGVPGGYTTFSSFLLKIRYTDARKQTKGRHFML